MAAHSILGVGLVTALLVGGCNGSGEGPTSTTTTTTAVASTTSIDPIAAEEAAVSEAAKQARLSLINALVNLEDPAAVSALDRWYVAGSPARATVDQSLQDLRDEGWRVRTHPEIPESLLVEEVRFEVDEVPTEGELIVCVVSSAILYEPAGAPNGGDAIINDAVASYRLRYLMTKAEGVWKLNSVDELERWEGVAGCPVAGS